MSNFVQIGKKNCGRTVTDGRTDGCRDRCFIMYKENGYLVKSMFQKLDTSNGVLGIGKRKYLLLPVAPSSAVAIFRCKRLILNFSKD